MSRLTIMTATNAQRVIEDLYKDLERRIIASPPGLCPVDMASAFLKLCHAQTCGKCVPCRIGLAQLQMLLEDVLEGRAALSTIDLIEKTAQNISWSADCAIGQEDADMVLRVCRDFGMIMRSISCTDAVRPVSISRFPVFPCVRPVWIFPAISHW